MEHTELEKEKERAEHGQKKKQYVVKQNDENALFAFQAEKKKIVHTRNSKRRNNGALCCFVTSIKLSSECERRFFSISPSLRRLCVPHPKSHIRWAFRSTAQNIANTTTHKLYLRFFFSLSLSFSSPALVVFSFLLAALSLLWFHHRFGFCCCHCCGLVCWFRFDFFQAITNDFALLSPSFFSFLSFRSTRCSDNEIFTVMIHRHCV